MDGTKLTPTKILRLMNLAESRTPNYCLPGHGTAPDSRKVHKDNSESVYSGESYFEKSANPNFESSLNILDLEGFEERRTQSFLTDKKPQPDSPPHSISFNTREMSGRSTEGLDRAGLQNDVEQLAARLRQQSSSVAAVVRDSITTDSFSVHNGDMTEEELMFIKDSSAIPLSDLNMNLTRTVDKKLNECSMKSESYGDISVGSYFNKGSIKMEHIIGRSESPKYDASAYLGPVLQDGDSRTYSEKAGFSTINDTAASDMALDCVPVKEARHNMQPTSLRNPYVEQLKQPASLAMGEESSIADASLSISLIAKCLGKMDVASTPSFLLAEVNRNKDTEKANDKTHTISSAVAKGQTIAPFKGKQLDRTENKTFKTADDPQPKIPPTPYRNSSKNTFTITDTNETQRYSNARNKFISDDESNGNNKIGTFVSTLASVGKCNTGSSVATVNTVISKPVIIISDDEADKENDSINNVSPNVMRKSNSDKDDGLFTPHANSTIADSFKDRVSSVRDVSPRRCGNSNMFTTRTASSYKTHSLTQSSSGDDKSKDIENFSTGYRELEKSINWPEILPTDNQEKDCWIRLEVEHLVAYIGISSILKISITSLTNRWLSVRLELEKTTTDDMNCEAFTLETCRAPIPLRPKATVPCSLAITATAELKSPISLVAVMQDTCSDRETFQKKQLNITFRTPQLKLYTMEGLCDHLRFPPTQENRNVCMPIVIKSDCPADLQLTMSIRSDGDCFSIAGFEIVEDTELCLDGDYRMVNSDGVRAGSADKHYRKANFTKRIRCILPHGEALRVVMSCKAPDFTHLTQQNNLAQLNGFVSIHTIVGNVLVKEIKISASVGVVRLMSKNAEPFQVSKGENCKVELCNAGSIESSWRVCTRNSPAGDESSYFKATPEKVTLGPGQLGQVEVLYDGPNDVQNGVLVLENTTDGSDVVWQLRSVAVSRGTFPVRTTHSEMCWARPDVTRDVRLKNTGRLRVNIRANVRGEGFHIVNNKDMESSTRHDGSFSFSLSSGECKELRVNFNPVKSGAHVAKLILCSATEPGLTKSVRLFGCGSCGSAVRWGRGVVRTLGGPALLPAPRDGRVLATLCNRGRATAFVAATLTFSWQFSNVSAGARLTGSQVLMLPGVTTTLGVNLDARRLQSAATSAPHAAAHHLATLSVLTGDDSTRRRILRIIQREPDAAQSIPGAEEQLKRLAHEFQNEDVAAVNLDGLNESKRSLPTLLSELEELTAHITLSKEALEDQTILPGDESSVHYHTLCDDITIL